jgi:F0F1-type ATP synthase membrane subunit a
MKVLILSHDEVSLSPREAIEKARSEHGSYATIVALPSSNNEYAQLYFAAQVLCADQLVKLKIDTKDIELYNSKKLLLIESIVTQFREVLDEVISDTEEAL